MKIEKSYFQGIPVSIFSLIELKNYIVTTIENSNRNILYGFSLHSIYSLAHLPEILTLGVDADLIVCDGRPFYWLLKAFRIPLKCNYSIPESVMLALQLANEQNYSVMLLGSTIENNNLASLNIKRKFPRIKVLEGVNGYFDFEKDLCSILEQIDNSKPDILLIGISSPLKERIAFLYKNKINAKLIIPCGGMIDVLAGKTRITPKFIKSIGLASIYRIIQEPKRLLKDRIRFYVFIFFNLLPLLFFKLVILREKNFSLIDHYT